MKKTKKLVNAIATLGLAIIPFVSVNAASVSYHQLPATGCVSGDVVNLEKCHLVPVSGSGQHGVAGEYFTVNVDGKNLWASCVDPGVTSPSGNVQEVKLNVKYQGIFDSACNTMSTLDSNEKKTILMKTVSSMSGFATFAAGGRNRTVYNGIDAGTYIWNEATYGAFSGAGDLATVAKDAIANAGKSSSSSVKFDTIENGLTLTTTVKGTLEANIGDYEVTIGTTSFTGSLELDAGTYTIKVKNPVCTTSAAGEVDFTFKYEEESGSTGGYTARLFESTTAGSAQRVIACDNNGSGDSNCDADGNCSATGTATVRCNPSVCDDDPNPIIGELPDDSDGAGICDANGTTIVNIYETPGDIYATSDELACLIANESKYLATDAILGDNPYCKIYCTQNYTLELPGPDARNGVEDMFINAGTYFTITEDGKMFSKNQVTCYGKTDTDAYEDLLNAIRNNIANAYSDYLKKDAYVNAVPIPGVKEVISPLSGETTTQEICTKSWSYSRLSLSGDTVTTYPDGGSETYDGPCSSANFNTYTASDRDAAKSNYESVLTASTTKLKTATEQLNECVDWNFGEFEKAVKDDACETEIFFDYYDGLISPTIEGETTTSTGDLESSSIREETKKTGANISYTGSSVSVSLNCNNSRCTASDLNGTSQIKNIEDYKGGTITVTTNYKFVGDEFCLDYETGDVLTGSSCTGDGKGKYSEKITGFPVSLETPQGRYYYQYTYSGIGYDFSVMDTDTCSIGKFDYLISDSDSIACYYDVNSCGDCAVGCDPEGDCELDWECDKGCKVACVGGGCILDFNAGFLATYRTFSLNDENFAQVAVLLSSEPTRTLAYSTSVNAPRTNWYTEKGIKAQEEITSAGEDIYESSGLEYSFVLTPSTISKIKNYNKDHNYIEDTLECEGSASGKYGQCTSTFIRDNTIFDADKVKYNSSFVEYPGTLKDFVGPAWK